MYRPEERRQSLQKSINIPSSNLTLNTFHVASKGEIPKYVKKGFFLGELLPNDASYFVLSGGPTTILDTLGRLNEAKRKTGILSLPQKLYYFDNLYRDGDKEVMWET